MSLAAPALPRIGAFPTAYDLISRVDPKSRQPVMVALFGTVLIVSAYIFVLSPRGYIKRHELQEYIDTRTAILNETLTKNAALATRIASLENDETTIEGIARDALSMARADETIYRFAEDGGPAYVLKP